MNVDNQITLMCAVRYALGRKTYAVSCVSNVLIDCWDALNKSNKERIVEEIKEAIKKEEAGMECDVRNWQRILLLNDADQKRRKKWK